MAEKPIALVTGGAQGIGLACAQALAEDGYRLVLADIKSDEVAAAAAELGSDTVAYPCDVSDPAAFTALFDTIEAEVGPVSALVNNAGIARPGDFMSYSLEDFQQVIALNVQAVFVGTQRAAKTMIEKNIEGAIINMSSINSQVAIPAIPAYCASKGAVNQLTKSSALALAQHNIRVNAVGPGSIDTEMMAGVNANPKALEVALSRTPLKRIGAAKEIGDVVAFLASPKAGYITGETIYVDGGRLGLNYTC